MADEHVKQQFSDGDAARGRSWNPFLDRRLPRLMRNLAISSIYGSQPHGLTLARNP